MTVESMEDGGIDFSDLRAQYQAVLDEDYSNILIIGNLPKVDQAKEDKLVAVLKKSVFSKATSGCNIKTMDMPKDPETGLSKGLLLLELESTAQADELFTIMDGFKLDKSHTLFALRFSDYERLLSLDSSAEYREPHIEPFEQKEHLKSWMMDPLARDQFIVQTVGPTGVNGTVFWNNKADKPEQVIQKTGWTDKGFMWSPRGSFLASHHHQGIAIWGGSNWSKIARFPHVGVQKFMFSPSERFLVTWSPYDAKRPMEDNLIVWETLSAKVVRGYAVDQGDAQWPHIQFSHDDAYACRVGQDFLAIYDTETFTVLDKKPVKVDGIKECMWSPVDHHLAFWVPGTDNTPTRVSIMQVPSRHIVRTKNLFSVIDCSMQWHSDGDYFGVYCNRQGKNKKQVISSFELFRMRQKDIPVDVIELHTSNATAEKQPEVISVSFEPNGDRLMVAVKDEFKILVSFYQLNHHDKTGSLPTTRLLKTLERKLLTKFLWSPRGDYALFTGMDAASGYMEFWSINDFVLLCSKEHVTATDAEWDPSGRFVISYISYSRFQSDNAFIVSDFKGVQLCKVNMPKMSWAAWRPRPKSMLTREQQKAIKKNLKAYSERFEQEDRIAADSSLSSAASHRANLLSSWAAFKMRTKERSDSRRHLRESILNSGNMHKHQQQRVEIEGWEEEVIEEKEENI